MYSDMEHFQRGTLVSMEYQYGSRTVGAGFGGTVGANFERHLICSDAGVQLRAKPQLPPITLPVSQLF